MATLVGEALQLGTGAEPLGLKPTFCALGLGRGVTALSAEGGVHHFIQSIIKDKPEAESPFMVLDLGVIVDLMQKWSTMLPTVQPFYAVKCNPNPSLLGTLAALGSSFDCASKAEIETILSLGVSPDRIIYANPCKSESHIKYAASVGVNVTTFDSKDEVQKIQKWHPKCELVLRIKPPQDSGARSSLGRKYGALPEEIPMLLQAAHASGLKVIGVSFHIGTGDADSRVYRGAIVAAKSVFDMASELGMPKMQLLDIGGGFTAGSQFEVAAMHVNAAVEANFAKEKEEGLVVIAEPGRYFSETSFTLASRIIGKRERGEAREYWIDDGVYGSLNCIVHDDGAVLTCTALACSSKPENPTCGGSKTYPSTVFGPTCDSVDTVLIEYPLPQLQINDWIVFPNMGAYSTACGSDFNGFCTSAITTHLVSSSPVSYEETLF